MSCYDCVAAQILPKPENLCYYSIYGYCRKDAGHEYPIYVPDGFCRARRPNIRNGKSGKVGNL